MIKPFIFNSSEEKTKQLLFTLEKIGLQRDQVYHLGKEEKWQLHCPWIKDEIILVWEKSWYLDGEVLEDSSLLIFINEELKNSIDIKTLLRAKLDKPIREIISKKLVDELKIYTGKA